MTKLKSRHGALPAALMIAAGLYAQAGAQPPSMVFSPGKKLAFDFSSSPNGGVRAHLGEATGCRRFEARVRLFGAHPVGALGQGDDSAGPDRHRQVVVRRRCGRMRTSLA